MKVLLISILILFASCNSGVPGTKKDRNMIDPNKEKKFFTLLSDFTVSSMKDSSQNWESAELVIEIQPGVVGMNGHYYSNNEKLWLEPRGKITQQIKEYHREVTKDGISKWNKMIFKLDSNNKFKTELVWDSIKQAQIDKYNNEAKKANPIYILPVWPWEEQK